MARKKQESLKLLRQLKVPVSVPRTAGLVLPIGLIVYSLLIRQWWVVSWDNTIYTTMCCLWLIVATIQFSPKSTMRPWAKVILNNIFVVYFAIFVEPFATPLVITWIVLGIEGVVTASVKAGVFTAACAIASAVFTSVQRGIDHISMFSLAASILAILFISAFVISMLKAYAKSESKLIDSMTNEFRQRERLDTTINAMTEMIVATDKKGRILLYNAATLDLLDTNKDLKGQNIAEVLHLTTEKQGRVDLAQFLASAQHITTRDNWYHTIKPKDRIRLEITISPIRSAFKGLDLGGVPRSLHAGFVLVMSDITKKKELEEEKDIFISKTSHELRKPVAMLEGSLSNLRLMQERGMLTKAKLEDALQATYGQAKYLAGLVGQLTSVSEAERNLDTKWENVDPASVVADMATRYRDEVAGKGLALKTDIGENLPFVKTSRIHLEEVLQNFIGNAIKYTPSGSITIGASFESSAGEVDFADGAVKFFIHDTGVGLSKADQTRIFEKFYRVEDYLTESTSGMGLGLYLVAKLAKLLGGMIDVESELGKNHGSTFSIAIPVGKKG